MLTITKYRKFLLKMIILPKRLFKKLIKVKNKVI